MLVCFCGLFAVGKCRRCGRPSCGTHGVELTSGFHCRSCQAEMVADESAREQKRKAEEKMQYSRLPEITVDELEDWLLGDLPIEYFIDGRTHQASTWTCERVYAAATASLEQHSIMLDYKHVLRESGVYADDGENRYVVKKLRADENYNRSQSFVALREALVKIGEGPSRVPRPMEKPPGIFGTGDKIFFGLFALVVTIGLIFLAINTL